jgi:hypothetical protein
MVVHVYKPSYLGGIAGGLCPDDGLGKTTRPHKTLSKK